MSQPFDEQFTRAFDSLSERLRATVADHASVTVAQFLAAVEADRRLVTERAAREAAAAAEREVTARMNEAFARREEQIKEAARVEWFEAGLQQARAEAVAIQQASDAEAAARRASVERLVDAVRALDATTSLSQALDALSAAAQAEADRVAIFLLRGDTLRAWSHAGFEAMNAVPGFEVPLTQAGVVADAARIGAPQRVSAASAGWPAFAGEATTGALVAVPLAMNDQVIGVLCGEQLAASDEGEWLATTCEVLARHAARVLASLTALRLAQLGPQASHAPSPSPYQGS